MVGNNVRNAALTSYPGYVAPPIPSLLYGWGNNVTAQLDNNSSGLYENQRGNFNTWVSSSYVAQQVFAIKSDGTLWSWGSGNNGGYESTDRSSPIQVGNETNWSKISVGFNLSHGMFIKSDGSLWGYGNNSNGQLGDNNSSDVSNRSYMIQVGSLKNWSQVTCGGSHTMAVKTDGTLWGWGLNTQGQLGVNNNITRSSPVQIGSLTNWSFVSAGASYTMAIKTDGTLWGWGLNSFGQVGDNTAITRSSPVQIGTGTNWSKVTTGASHTMAVKTDGTIWTWGSNNNGELGFSTGGATISSPVQVGLHQ
jgi:alpha-tubulin suppressor-like RCC1 family protein